MKIQFRLVCAALSLLACGAWADSLEAAFQQPPRETRPSCYWYWLSDNISTQGITKDLEAMARVGIGEAFIGNILEKGVPSGPVKVLSEEWWRSIEHAIREGGRTGVDVGLFNCPGWSQSGGPWITPDKAMRYLVSSELRVQGPRKLEQKLAAPADPFQQVAVLAFRAVPGDDDTLAKHAPRLTAQPAGQGIERWIDDDPQTGAPLPGRPLTIEIEVAEPFAAQSLMLHPVAGPIFFSSELSVQAEDGSWKSVAKLDLKRENVSINVGPIPFGPAAISFDPVTAKKFRLVITGGGGAGQLGEIRIGARARVDHFIEKQLGKMHPTPLPMADAYRWPQPAPLAAVHSCIPPKAVLNLTDKVSADGTLRWDVPVGDWIVQRTGMTPTGTKNSPASPEGVGLEVDKMNRKLAAEHFDAYAGNLLRRMPAADRKGFKRVIADSYEMGSQNWTDGLEADFRKVYGYDPLPWLPVLAGHVVGTADQSDRFLWDLRRLVADRVASDYVGGLRAKCNDKGLRLWLENYGHWGFPAEFLQYGGASDDVGGEYWLNSDLGSIECRAASSCAHTYGKKVVSAESFTSGFAFRQHPRDLKARGDWAFCEGINHYVLHVNIHQPWDDRKPGVNAWFGTDFNRNSTWFEYSGAWIDYVRRCCALLQRGVDVADVAYFIGEDTPRMTGAKTPALPPGYNFDFINAEVLKKATARDGQLALAHGTRYRVLVLPEQETMRPELLGKIRELIHDGVTVLGPPPMRSPSLAGHPVCDAEVTAIAREIWGELAAKTVGAHPFGKGRIIRGLDLEKIFALDGLVPDFSCARPLRFTHRRDGGTDIYFVANPDPREVSVTASFRAGQRAPEFWDPVTGRMEKPAVYDVGVRDVRVPLRLAPHGSVFVVFRDEPSARRVVAASRNGVPLLDLGPVRNRANAADVGPNSFTFAAWIKPEADTVILKEATAGIAGLHDVRNDVIAPPHGDTFPSGNSPAGCGLAVGRNGVAVFEHGAGYFVPTLAHAVALKDWTHVTVVYRDGQPSLYLDGVPARTGLKSSHTVFCGVTQAGAAGDFRGKAGAFEVLPSALSDAEVAALAKSMPREGAEVAGPAIAWTFEGSRVVPEVRAPGRYVWTDAAGSTTTLDVASVPEVRTITGPWTVRFDPAAGGPGEVRFDTLADWSTRPEDGIRYYSGTAVYKTTFEVAAATGRVELDLGDVQVMARVRLNGKDLGTVWAKPSVVELGGALRPGSNELEIEVVNTWWNRLVGDEQPGAKRTTSATVRQWKTGDKLQPAGLLGPVRIVTRAAFQS